MQTHRLAGRTIVSSGSTFERDVGYARAVVVGDRVLVAGTTGFDYATMTIASDVESQVRQCLANLEAALAAAGSTLSDAVRVRYILPDAAEFPATWPFLREAFGRTRPAATMIEARLADPRMRIEIELEAVIGSGRG
jgi:enamine deaminase RidA (YjgF/YER057c/UK114 family)